MGQGAGPCFNHLYPEKLGSRVPGLTSPSLPDLSVGKWGSWSQPQRPLGPLPSLSVRAGTCLTQDRSALTGTPVPCVLPVASTGTGEVMRVTIFKIFNTWDTYVN